MNSPYDPLYTAGGGNCTGFATLLGLYSRFYVKKARIQFQPATISNAGDLLFVLPVRSDEAAAGVVPDIDMVTESQVTTYNQATNAPSAYLVIGQVCRPAAFQGLENSDGSCSNKDEMSGYVTTDPIIQPAWYLGLIGAQGHTATGALLIEYTCELFRPNTLSNA